MSVKSCRLNHIYSSSTTAPGYAWTGLEHNPIPLVSGITLYDMSEPWAPPRTGGSNSAPSGYCSVSSRFSNHQCPESLGENYGSTAQLLWQWSPARAGPGQNSFDFPVEAGLRLDAQRTYSFVIQIDYDMRYFFGEDAAGRVGAGQIEWQQWQPWDYSGIRLHETASLRQHDAAVLSLTQLDFSLGSNAQVNGVDPTGAVVSLPPLARTSALFPLAPSLGDQYLASGGSVWIFGFGGKTRFAGTTVELAIWSPQSGTQSGQRTRAARWIHPQGEPWTEMPLRPHMDMLGGLSSVGSTVPTVQPSYAAATSGQVSDPYGHSLTENDLIRLRCEFSVRDASVDGGYGYRDELCAAHLYVYPAEQLRKHSAVVTNPSSHSAAGLPAGVGSDSETWLTSNLGYTITG